MKLERSDREESVVSGGFNELAKFDAVDILTMFRFNPRARHPALLVRQDGSENCVTITEFTQSGFRLAVVARPDLGEDIQIRVAGQPDIPGKIRWSYGAEAGGSF
jgi:hypothetical protein